MAALTDRQKARERLSQVFTSILDKMIPADESVPLAGKKFVEWEDMADDVDRTLVPVFLEERAALEVSAQADCGGRCPYCQSDRVYLIKRAGQVEVLTPHGPVVLKKQKCRCRSCDRSFPPQERDWGLPAEASLSPKAAARVAREAATQSFDNAARALNLDWGTSLDGKQVQRWGEALGRTLVKQREKELASFQKGVRPVAKANEHELLVIGMDGGRVQTREKSLESGSRWKEDKVLTITSCLKGDGHEKPPKKLLTTYVATMGDAQAFGPLARLEAERRGIRNAVEVIGIHDGGNWIDPLWEERFGCHRRILDYYHAAEHLHEVARSACPGAGKEADTLADELVTLLWDGQTAALQAKLVGLSTQAGAPLETDPPTHPRKVLAQNAGYFQRHRDQMDYPRYRARGWPIGSGITESGVKLFAKRVKGTEQFWSVAGAEAILALRSKWLSEDEEAQHYWLGQGLKGAAA